METKPIYSQLDALGKSGVQASKNLETVTLPEGHRISHVALETDEFTSFCPVTGQPDFGRVYLSYSPRNKIVESKSLKLYWQSFRNDAEFWELLADKMLADFIAVLDPKFCMVMVRQNPRGGIPLTASATYSADDNDDEDDDERISDFPEFEDVVTAEERRLQILDDIPF